MTNNIEQVISLKISGTELQKQQGYNLRYIVDSLSSIEDLVDKTYLFSQKNTG